MRKTTVRNTARFLATDNKTLEKDVFWIGSWLKIDRF